MREIKKKGGTRVKQLRARSTLALPIWATCISSTCNQQSRKLSESCQKRGCFWLYIQQHSTQVRPSLSLSLFLGVRRSLLSEQQDPTAQLLSFERVQKLTHRRLFRAREKAGSAFFTTRTTTTTENQQGGGHLSEIHRVKGFSFIFRAALI